MQGTIIANLKELKEKLSENQFKGILLEISSYQALTELGIRPKPLHNPFDERYARENRPNVDSLFIHKGLLYGVECKNLSLEWRWEHKTWAEEKVVKKFKFHNKIFPESPINVKVLLISYPKAIIFQHLDSSYCLLALGYQEKIELFHLTIRRLKNHYDRLFQSINSEKTARKYTLTKRYRKLQYIKRKMRRKGVLYVWN